MLSSSNNSYRTAQLTEKSDIELGSTDVALEEEESPIMASERKRAPTFSPQAPDNAPSILTFDKVKVTSKRNGAIILNEVSGLINGGFWAIMGSSGSGKTTLLSTLSLRLDTIYMTIEGDMRLNGKKYSTSLLKQISAYVMQDDLVMAELTVQETIAYASHLRLPPTMTASQRKEREDEVIQMMGIEHCRHTVVGDTRRKGISGGERKRLCIAVELLSKPKLLFLDEPTSGLDSSTSLSICRLLKNIAASGECTIVCTIHQPQQKIFELFDNLVLMKQGNIVYQGGAQKSLEYFIAIGHPVPPGENPADHILNVITPPKQKDSAHEEHHFVVPIDLTLGEDKPALVGSGLVSWWTQFSVLFQRSIIQYTRRHTIIFMNLAVTLLLATFISQGIWRKIGTTQDSIPTRLPSLFFACVTQGVVASLQSVNNFPGERALMLRERQAGTYTVSAYFMAKTVTDMLTTLWPPIIFTCLVYPEIGYQPVTSKFFKYMLFMILDTLAATSVATAVSCICVSVEMTTVVLAGCFEISRLYGGFFTSPAQLLDYPHWKFADALSYIKYCFVGIALNELKGLELSCTDAQIAQNTCISTGEAIIEQKGYDQYHEDFCVGILVVYIVGCRLLAFIALKFLKK
jgi:ABC-type multidrug transport system ATPase subunit